MLRYALIALSLMTSSAIAQVQLFVEPHIKVIAINGDTVRQGAFAPPRREFNLPAGPVAITARYDQMFELSGDNHDYVRSKNISIKATLQEEGRYTLSTAENPKSHQAAKQYAKNPTLVIKKEGQTVATVSNADNSLSLAENFGALFGYEKDKKQVQHSTSNQLDVLDQFIQLWLVASDEERQKIRQWLK